MKIVIRSLAVALLLTGLVATTHSLQPSSIRDGQVAVSHQVASSLIPTPNCPPDDPDACTVGSKPKGK